MKMSKLSNHTNSQDPQAVNSRVFVGNLNTFQCSKTDVERMFQKYGRLAGISMHKGYAFVQFTNPFDARNACLGEDGRTVLGQVLDANIVAEPKEHQMIMTVSVTNTINRIDIGYIGNQQNVACLNRKRQNNTKTGNDWDYYYDSYYASTVFPGRTILATRPVKRQRLMTPQQMRQNLATNQRLHASQQQIFLPANVITNGCAPLFPIDVSNGEPRSHLAEAAAVATNGMQLQQQSVHPIAQQQPNTFGALKLYSTPDTLICGNCKELFAGIGELLEHKQTYCKLRFVCKCNSVTNINGNNSSSNNNNSSSTTNLLCAICKQHYTNAWDLMVHVQEAHMINIYTLGMDVETNNNDECIDNSNCPSDGGEAAIGPAHENIASYLGCIDNGACLQNGLDYHRQSPPVAIAADRPSIVDLKLNSVESAILSSGSSRESSLSPQMILSSQHSQNGDKDIDTSSAELSLPCTDTIACSQALEAGGGGLV